MVLQLGVSCHGHDRVLKEEAEGFHFRPPDGHSDEGASCKGRYVCVYPNGNKWVGEMHMTRFTDYLAGLSLSLATCDVMGYKTVESSAIARLQTISPS